MGAMNAINDKEGLEYIQGMNYLYEFEDAFPENKRFYAGGLNITGYNEAIRTKVLKLWGVKDNEVVCFKNTNDEGRIALIYDNNPYVSNSCCTNNTYFRHDQW